MQSCFKLLPIAAMAVLYLSKIGSGMRHSVAVQLDYSSPLTNVECFGGDAALTNTSIMLQYTTAIEGPTMHPSSSDATDAQDEWTTLSAIKPLNTSLYSQVSANFSVDGSVGGLQFRLLQLEHGGGSCNCWTFESMTVTLDNQTESLLLGEGDICFTSGEMGQGPRPGTFCYDDAGVARGSITRVLYFPGNNGSTCGKNNNTLISSLGPSLPDNCSTVTPRL